MKKVRLKIYSSGLGSKVFISRLSKNLTSNFPVDIVDKREDIYLSCVWRGPGKSKDAIWIHRADGVYFDELRHGRTGMNKKIKKNIKRSDAVIFQSDFSKKICKGVLGISKNESRIIYNGCDPDIYKKSIKDKMGYKKMLVACARWVPLKRPRSIINGFIRADLKDTVLVMIGKIDKKNMIPHPNVKYLGHIKPFETYKHYASCDGVIHISRLDACPNAVVEALCAGNPVLSNNVGGTPELVKDDGVIIDIDPICKYRSFKMKRPDKVSPKIVSVGIKELLSREWSIHRPDLHIINVAGQYYDYFRYLLDRR